MLTPPYHFSIVASSLLPSTHDASSTDTSRPSETLYRGSIPAARNLPFLKRLGLRTIVLLRKKPLKEHDVLLRWAKRHGVEVRWVKAEGMGEENLGMGRIEVGEVLKVLLDTMAYPMYVADVDGISHTTLAVAALRKLQGWHMTSIIDEIFRQVLPRPFEPDHEDLPLVPFITSYLTSGPSSEALVLPLPPYPSWLWPAPAAPLNSLSRTSTTVRERERDRDRETRDKDKDRDRGDRSDRIERDREKDRDRNDREKTNSGTSSTPTSTSLPFSHPLTSRKHPTMRLVFPPVSLQAPPSTLSRVPSRRDKTLSPTQTVSSPPNDTGLMGTAASLLSGLAGVVVGGAVNATEGAGGEGARGPRTVNFGSGTSNGIGNGRGQTVSSGSNSPEKLSRVTTISSGIPVPPGLEEEEEGPEETIESEEEDEEEEEDEDEYGEEDEDEDEDEDEEEEEEDDELQPTSLHISALDLAGYG